jgi:hypothetical protein
MEHQRRKTKMSDLVFAATVFRLRTRRITALYGVLPRQSSRSQSAARHIAERHAPLTLAADAPVTNGASWEKLTNWSRRKFA